MNLNNLAQKTAWEAGSNKLQLANLYIQNFSIPGISFSHPDIFAHSAVKIGLVADNMSFNECSFDLLIDENYRMYFEIMDIVFKQFNPENGTFANQEFDFFVNLKNQKGENIFTINFFNCRFTSIGDITLSTQGDETYNTLNVSIRYDYYKIENLKELAQKGLQKLQLREILNIFIIFSVNTNSINNTQIINKKKC